MLGAARNSDPIAGTEAVLEMEWDRSTDYYLDGYQLEYQYGFDNWVWGTVGYSGFSGTIGGKDYRFSQGMWRVKPDGTADGADEY